MATNTATSGDRVATLPVELRVICSSGADLESIAELLGVEVQTQSGTRIAQGRFGPVLLVASASATAGGQS